LNIFDVARLIGFLILAKVERVVEQEADICYGCGAIRKLLAIQEEGLVRRRDVNFFVDLGKRTTGDIARNEPE